MFCSSHLETATWLLLPEVPLGLQEYQAIQQLGSIFLELLFHNVE